MKCPSDAGRNNIKTLSSHTKTNMTPEELSAYIASAKTSKKSGGIDDAMQWKILNGGSGVDEVDPIRMRATEALGNTIFNMHDGQLASISLKCYEELEIKLSTLIYERKIVLMAGGGNATAFQMKRYGDYDCSEEEKTNKNKNLFKYSDLDLKIMIRPGPDFDMIKERVCGVVNQVFATHKRRFDRIFFKKRENDRETNIIFSDEQAELFAETFSMCLGKDYISPLDDEAVRNQCSTNSYIITKSSGAAGKNVMIRVPHLEKAEKVPLGFSPLFVSVNMSIDGSGQQQQGQQMPTSLDDDSSCSSGTTDSAAADRVTSFTLYRLRLNVLKRVPVRLALEVSDGSDNNSDSDAIDEEVSVRIEVPFQKVTLDFIDLSIPDQNDTELLDFERRDGFKGALTRDIPVCGFNILVPTLYEIKAEYYKMLNVFECPLSKRAKRELKYDCICKTIKKFVETNHKDLAQLDRLHARLSANKQGRKDRDNEQQAMFQNFEQFAFQPPPPPPRIKAGKL